MYLRLYVSQTLLGYMFDLDDSNVNREINARMMPSLKQVLPVPMEEELLTPSSVQAHAKKRIGTLKELLEAHPEFKELLVDASEQEVPKPKRKLARKQRYSGKKKQHTLKSQVTVSNRLVLHLSICLSMYRVQLMISAYSVPQGLCTACKLRNVNFGSTKAFDCEHSPVYQLLWRGFNDLYSTPH
jgi:DDE superfamily endonuclease